MSQYNFGNLESPLSGANFVNTHMEPWRDAVHSTHSGGARPSYATAGMMWINSTAAKWILYIFDGVEDIKLGTIDTTNNIFIPENTGSWAGTAGGTANAITLTPTQSITAYTAGQAFDFIINATNTTAGPTIAVSGLAAKTVKANLGAGKVNAPKGSMVAGSLARVIYDGTDFVYTNIRPHNVGASIGSAATVNLNAATGDYITITGTTTITAFTLAEGQKVTLKPDNDVIIESSASIIIPGGKDIQAMNGDTFIIRGEAGGVVRIMDFTRANGTPIIISTQAADVAASSDTTFNIDYTDGDVVKVTFTSDCTLDFTFPADIPNSMLLQFLTAGSHTITFPAGIKFSGAALPEFSAEDHVVIYQNKDNEISLLLAGAEMGTV